MPDGEDNRREGSWSNWSGYVFEELKRQGKLGENLRCDLHDLEIVVAKLEAHFKSQSKTLGAIWGLASGVIGALVILAIKHFWP